MRTSTLGWHLAALGLVSFAIGLLFLREPGFGDDFTYWSFAFDLHERGLRAWQRHSFHDLRWPVWGVSWVAQALTGPGLFSFYVVPLAYLAGGAALAWTFGRLASGSLAVAWTAGVLFAFHPLLDSVCYRPMPDLSEGVWGAAAVLVWWHGVQARGRSSVGLALLLGLVLVIAQANRITGVFIVGVLLLATLAFARHRVGWLALAGAFAALFYAAEAGFYYHLFSDPLHSIHANLGNKGAKGIDAPAVWILPFRFLDALWKGNTLAPFYCVLAGLGLWVASRRTPVPGNPGAPPVPRLIALWLVALYLAYACAPQSIRPWKPLLRDADRFLAGLAIPMSVLGAMGGAWALGLPRARRYRVVRWPAEHPAVAGLLATGLLVLVTSRDRASLGFVPEMRAHLGSLSPGARVFTHEPMRQLAFLVNPAAARTLYWTAPPTILERTAEREAQAEEADHLWYIRKLVWLQTRKALERGKFATQPPLPTYFAQPEKRWFLDRLLARGDTPDLVFYRKRQPGDSLPRVFNATSAESSALGIQAPWEWTGSGDRRSEVKGEVPASLRGKLARLDLEAASAEVEALTLRLRFFEGESMIAEYLLKPYLYPGGGKEFFAFTIPAMAASFTAQARLSKKSGTVRITGGQLLVEDTGD